MTDKQNVNLSGFLNIDEKSLELALNKLFEVYNIEADDVLQYKPRLVKREI